MQPLVLCMVASAAIHGVVWQLAYTPSPTPPRLRTRQGLIAVEINLLPTATTTAPEESPNPAPPPLVVPPSGAPPSTTTIPPIPAKAGTTNPPTPPLVAPPSGGPPSQAPESSPEPLVGIQNVPTTLEDIAPVYPRLSRRRGEEGTVIVALTVNAEGKPENARIKQGSGFPLLDKAALQAIQRTSFSPARLDGSPISAPLEQTIEFKLKDE